MGQESGENLGVGEGLQLGPFVALQIFGVGPRSPCQRKTWSEGLHWWVNWNSEIPLG